ncbi:hypothetical protein CEXT_128501 [Caerostris extrusa]|uniref:Uncharacterized protein n=1 Tax=Caerostris extrusa TaxID=172846 RepID=A0AAV4S789_CAEEX|nr:hypothetical protein CEXT_128501 [Caerostris extrusa]
MWRNARTSSSTPPYHPPITPACVTRNQRLRKRQRVHFYTPANNCSGLDSWPPVLMLSKKKGGMFTEQLTQAANLMKNRTVSPLANNREGGLA